MRFVCATLLALCLSFSARFPAAATPEATIAELREGEALNESTSLNTQQPIDTMRVLNAEDIALYREIFALQEGGNWQAADAKIAQLENEILLGYVQHQRYMHPTDYRSKFAELKKWMAYYADHPQASKVYSLAMKRRPKNYSSPVRPVTRKWRKSESEKVFHPDLQADYDKTSGPTLRRIEGRVRYLAHRNQALKALKEIDRHLSRRTITVRQYDRMRSWIAASLYYQGYVDRAKTIANEAAARSSESAVLAHWISGLIEFRNGNDAGAYNHFSAMAENPFQEDGLRSAGGFWAARTALSSGAFEGIAPNLEIASAYPFTFYGQLALAQLGRDYDYNWSTPSITEDAFNRLLDAEPRIKRAVALAQVGRTSEADLELRWAIGELPEELDRNVLAVAAGLELPAAQIDIALTSDEDHLEASLFPVPTYAPQDGFKVDRALLYALMRQESKFKTDATSRVGARGLMQLMPRTASYVANDRSLRYRSGRNRLYDPGFNMKLGQSYVSYLMDRAVDGDLFHMAAAYNGGPGNLRRWKRKVQIEDPLLFIESIPNRESRDFVETVLTNFWIYRARLGQPAPSRAKVAAGELPLYEAIDQIAVN